MRKFMSRAIFATPIIAAVLAVAAPAGAAEAGRIVFVTGNVQVAGVPASNGSAVQEGDALVTGADGYLYIKTVDEGLFILRPQSEAKIVTYHVDKVEPSRTQVKLELTKGVARSQSGKAVKAARQNFRFNTPVAAIGVRGTDFTVFTDQETSRVAVISGAITMSSFGGGCQPGGTGPCGSGSELSALQRGQLLEVRRGQATPRLMQGGAVAPDIVAPPRTDEPLGKEKEGADASLLDAHKSGVLAQQALNATVQPPPQEPEIPVVTPPVPPVVVEIVRQGREVSWGRWQAVYDKDANSRLTKAGADSLDNNETYVLFRNRAGDPYVLPERGTAGFVLTGGEAYVRDMATQVRTAATISNGQLMIDFGNARYTTGFDLRHDSQDYRLASSGRVEKDGLFSNSNQYTPANNISIFGALDNNNGATYLFQGALRPGKIVSGVTTWAR
ncbi:hypothetical protein GM672_11660 [Massilia buxea]|uniref:FecR protein domain-containing protein n=2 Tax=Pseudoduganella buxea TaxID=1949069 RepID=A0A6I3SYP8_9BURK|nr:hypothetical protein [Pseudoduganella buxea]